VEEGLRVGTFEGLNHGNIVYRSTIYGKSPRLASERSNASCLGPPPKQDFSDSSQSASGRRSSGTEN
jgi:hypothetical protein